MNAQEIENELASVASQIEDLTTRRLRLETDLRHRLAFEREIRERAEWLAVRTLTCPQGRFYAAATDRIGTAGGRVIRFFVGLGLARKDSGELELLSVYEVTDYRGRVASRIHGSCPPVEVDLEFRRHFGIKKVTDE